VGGDEGCRGRPPSSGWGGGGNRRRGGARCFGAGWDCEGEGKWLSLDEGSLPLSEMESGGGTQLDDGTRDPTVDGPRAHVGAFGPVLAVGVRRVPSALASSNLGVREYKQELAMTGQFRRFASP
jgi:hypothetical protein